MKETQENEKLKKLCLKAKGGGGKRQYRQIDGPTLLNSTFFYNILYPTINMIDPLIDYFIFYIFLMCNYVKH